MMLLDTSEAPQAGVFHATRSCRDDAASLVWTSAALYERYFDFVLGAARRLCVDEEDVEDAIQDVFVVVHRRLDDFECRASAETLLFGILLRVAQHYRRAKVRRSKKRTVILRNRVAFDNPPDDALETLAKRERLAGLHALLSRLDVAKRTVVIRVELEERTAREAAEELGININTVYSRLRIARQELQRAVARAVPPPHDE